MKKGFTLLELLIVIIIIGLLASIGFVQYGRAVGNAKNAKAKSTLAEMKKVAQAYQAVHNSWPDAGTSIIVNIDGEASLEFDNADISDADYEYAIVAGGTGTATHGEGQQSNVRNWTINFATGALTTAS